jgi:hypothetical protein
MRAFRIHVQAVASQHLSIMIVRSSTPMLGVSNQSFLASSESLSRAKSCENRARATELEHISEVLARISATLDRQPLGKLLEQEEGRSHLSLPQNQGVAPLPVTTSYPFQGGVA